MYALLVLATVVSACLFGVPNKDWVMAMRGGDSFLVLNACQDASMCKGSQLCLVDKGKRMIAAFGRPAVKQDEAKVLWTFANPDNTVSSDGFPFVGQVRFLCERDDELDRGFSGLPLTAPFEFHVQSPLYQVTWRHSSFCPIERSASNTLTRLSVLALGLAAMWLVGVAYNLLAREKTFPDALPGCWIVREMIDTVKTFRANVKYRLLHDVPTELTSYPLL